MKPDIKPGPDVPVDFVNLSELIGDSQFSYETVQQTVVNYVYSGASILYPWFYSRLSDGSFIHKDVPDKIYCTFKDKDSFKRYIDCLKEEAKILKDELKPFTLYDKCIEEFYDENLKEVTPALFKSVVCSVPKSFIPECASDFEWLYHYINPFDISRKHKQTGMLYSKPKSFFVSLKNNVLSFFDENNLKKDGLEMYFDFIEKVLYTDYLFPETDSMDYEDACNAWSILSETILADFFENSKILEETCVMQTDLLKYVTFDIKFMSDIYNIYETVEFLQETHKNLNRSESLFDDVCSINSRLDDAELEQMEWASFIDEHKVLAQHRLKERYARMIERSKNELDAFYDDYEVLDADMIDALYYVMSRHEYIKTFDGLRNFASSDVYRDEWHSSKENEIIYRKVNRFFTKKIRKGKIDIVQAKSDVNQFLSDSGQFLILRENYNALLTEEKQELANLEEIFPYFLGISDKYEKIKMLASDSAKLAAEKEAQTKPLKLLRANVLKAIKIMKKEGLDEGVFDSADDPFNVLTLSYLEKNLGVIDSILNV
ncbi:MAG: hypothetical protein U9P44_01080 [archaeon]|nr:hypothetical protein [archaeon]